MRVTAGVSGSGDVVPAVVGGSGWVAGGVDSSDLSLRGGCGDWGCLDDGGRGSGVDFLGGDVVGDDEVVVGLGEGPLVDELLVSQGVSDLVEGSLVNLVEEFVLVQFVVRLDPGVVLGVVLGVVVGVCGVDWCGFIGHFCDFVWKICSEE